jgi:hypothetical protein
VREQEREEHGSGRYELTHHCRQFDGKARTALSFHTHAGCLVRARTRQRCRDPGAGEREKRERERDESPGAAHCKPVVMLGVTTFEVVPAQTQ